MVLAAKIRPGIKKGNFSKISNYPIFRKNLYITQKIKMIIIIGPAALHSFCIKGHPMTQSLVCNTPIKVARF